MLEPRLVRQCEKEIPIQVWRRLQYPQDKQFRKMYLSFTNIRLSGDILKMYYKKESYFTLDTSRLTVSSKEKLVLKPIGFSGFRRA